MQYNIFTESLNSYYWLGFLLADGHFSKNKVIEVNLALADLEHLEKFKKFTKSNNPITIETKSHGFNKDKPSARFRICDQHNIRYLCNKFNITNHKTKNPPLLRIPEMTDNQFLALVIGYIDGDGYICKRRNHYELTLTVHVNWLDNLRLIENNIRIITGIGYKNNLSKITKRGFARLCLNSKVIIYLKQFIQEHALPVLERKWAIVDTNILMKSEYHQNLHTKIAPVIKVLREQHKMQFKHIQQYINSTYNLQLSKSVIQHNYYKITDNLFHPKNLQHTHRVYS